MKTQEELLQAISEVRAMIGTYHTDEWASWRSALEDITTLLDHLETRLQAGWPPATPDAFENVNIGLYAIRNLDELDGGRLSLKICSLDYALKRRDC